MSQSYKPKNAIRIVTAASLFDGHDASINIMRRILQDLGAEVIHLGHNRSVRDVVTAALQEGAQGIAVSSYQGGHMEYFKYMKDLLDAHGAPYVKIFGGGGGVIIHEEKTELEAYGIARVYHPDDGRKLGLEGMIADIVQTCDFSLLEAAKGIKWTRPEGIYDLGPISFRDIGLGITAVEQEASDAVMKTLTLPQGTTSPLVIGVTGTGGAGKSSLIDELVQRFRNMYPAVNVGVVCVDPSKKKTGGALLGDRIRMNSLSRENTFMRSLASRGSGNEISGSLPQVLNFLKTLNFDVLIAESSGIGQANVAITEVCDLSLYVMTSEFGAQSQLEKIDMIDYADFVAINKADRRGSEDALRDVSKQYKRSRKLFDQNVKVPVHMTQASNFNDQGVNALFLNITDVLKDKTEESKWQIQDEQKQMLLDAQKQVIVPADRQHYLSEVTTTVRRYKKDVEKQAQKFEQLGALELVSKTLSSNAEIASQIQSLEKELDPQDLKAVRTWDELVQQYSGDELVYEVRNKPVKQNLRAPSLAGTLIPRVVVPRLGSFGDRYRFLKLENRPGEFPYTAGVFPLKRQGEDPTRQFAGEGPPERTNKRFHYLSKGEQAKRLSTAFDSVTLYGQDPDLRPDIFGKVGESGVSIATLEDMKRLYDGFDLCDPMTSVSMTINGPAPMILAFFMNTAIDQRKEKMAQEVGRALTLEEEKQAEEYALQNVRGTVQADILKEDQGQNTCIFSIDFALKMMGDIQKYFIDQKVRNFYSVSISGYHIAEAGANPITQLALTLSNAFTYVEYYKSRGMSVDEFAPNFSFFFSNGMDPEYSVLGRVARRIWAIAMKDMYGANDRSQKLKYHIQTSGRSLHAQEIQFNDIRTTLQALLAIVDHCNSLHTNAYDEAITTPTEESVRRAKAIQLIINKELGTAKNENSMQGSYFYEWLTDAVEEAVLEEFQKISDRGGVLGAMETQYQRGKIQEESLYYETLKHDGTYPLVGVNTFIDPKTLEEGFKPPKIELARASLDEKNLQLNRTNEYKKTHAVEAEKALAHLKKTALEHGNVFEALMRAARCCTLYQMTEALYEVGGQYRRNL
ncbi:MAG: methylmalonyl-CoA mutase family protein [Bdellovibrionaceae bacterium]|nr:methylmalonyl-CoA mutase family protein [Pseudobdellovibrionaceae bacterium]